MLMSRRHEQARRDADESDPDARIVRHGNRLVVIVEASNAPGDVLPLLAKRSEKDALDAREWAARAIDDGEVVYYCRGPGWPVVACHTLSQWDAAVARGELPSH